MARLTKQQAEALKHLKNEINSPKHKLIDYMRQIEEISPSQAAALGKIIGKLETWQNK